MKLITRDTDYAVRALCCIAKNVIKDKIISVSELVRQLNIPKPFLRKLLQTLNNKGLLVSYKGKGGGFQLASRPGSITLFDLIEIFQGPMKLSEHTLKGKKCPHVNTCVLKKRLDRIESRVIDELKTISIASLVKSGGKING